MDVGADEMDDRSTMPRLGYVPALDGLRGVAILLVLGCHVGGWWAGGRALISFFVLSGFLITTLLLEERERHGRVSMSGFYARRARRLLPALGLFLVWLPRNRSGARLQRTGPSSPLTASTSATISPSTARRALAATH